jgi:transglutaminase-like putative cysteine protease
MKVSIHYETRYIYEKPVSFSPHTFRFFPRPSASLRVRHQEFSTHPDSNVHRSRDLFDNEVACCFYPEPDSSLETRLDLELELQPFNPFGFLLEPHALAVPFHYHPRELDMLAAYLRNPDAAPPVLPFWERPSNPRPSTELLVELNSAIHREIQYERREEGDARPAHETLSLGRGACRDFAVLLAGELRALGIASRLASGFLCEFDAEEKRAEGALHAWTEAYLPGAGWIGLDPTNGVLCAEHHILTAVGLTPRDIAPVSGNYFHAESLPSQMITSLSIHEKS